MYMLSGWGKTSIGGGRVGVRAFAPILGVLPNIDLDKILTILCFFHVLCWLDFAVGL